MNGPSTCNRDEEHRSSAVILLAKGEGHESGGGGTIVDERGRSLLLDFFRLGAPATGDFQDPDRIVIDGNLYTKSRFSDAFLSEVAVGPKTLSNRPSDPRDPPPNLIRSGDDFLKSGAVRLAEKIISDWNTSQAGIIQLSLLDRSSSMLLSKIHWRIQASNIKGPVYPLDAFGRTDLAHPRLAALFTNSDQGTKDGTRAIGLQIQVNAPEWNKLSLLSQTGLILHEYLRAAQFMNIVPGMVYRAYDDRQLQVATSALLACKPEPVMGLYLSMVLTGLDGIIAQDPSFGSFSQVLSGHCPRAETRPE